jgi:hypothetical protein
MERAARKKGAGRWSSAASSRKNGADRKNSMQPAWFYDSSLSAWGRTEEARVSPQRVSPGVELGEGGHEHDEALQHAAVEAVPDRRARGLHRGASWRLTWGAPGRSEDRRRGGKDTGQMRGAKRRIEHSGVGE